MLEKSNTLNKGNMSAYNTIFRCLDCDTIILLKNEQKDQHRCGLIELSIENGNKDYRKDYLDES